jgi:hypothetical protein
VGSKGTILRYINNKWAKVASGTNADLQGVAAVSDSLACAVGAKVGVGCGRHFAHTYTTLPNVHALTRML